MAIWAPIHDRESRAALSERRAPPAAYGECSGGSIGAFDVVQSFMLENQGGRIGGGRMNERGALMARLNQLYVEFPSGFRKQLTYI